MRSLPQAVSIKYGEVSGFRQEAYKDARTFVETLEKEMNKRLFMEKKEIILSVEFSRDS